MLWFSVSDYKRDALEPDGHALREEYVGLHHLKKQCAVLLSLRPLILGSRRIGWISSCTRGRAEVSELARPRRFSAPMLAILAAAVVGLRGPGASQPESLRSAFQEMCSKRWLRGKKNRYNTAS